MKSDIELKWVCAPRQDRSWKTLQRIQEAAELLLAKRGFESVGVAEIAQQAGSSVGAIYARFRDKNGLLNFLHEQFCEEAMATADAVLDEGRWEGASAQEIVSALTAFLVRVYSERGGLLRAFHFHGCKDPHFQERSMKLGEHFLRRLKRLLLVRVEEIGHPDPVLAVAFGMNLVLSVLQERFVFNEVVHREWNFSLGQLEGELSRAYGAYLGLPHGEGTAVRSWPKQAVTG